jgi:tetratricopeptide (TPR) repeat protein/uncharacterized protein YjbI with pentapeptide repeats
MTHSPSEHPSLDDLREAALLDPTRFRPRLARALMDRAMAMSLRDEAMESADLIVEAVALYRWLADKDRNALPGLAAALNNLGIRLGEMGNTTGALEATIEAVNLYRQLSGDDRHYLRNLATASSNLGIQFGEIGDSMRSLRATEEAVALYRQLATGNPEYLPYFAAALHRFATQQFAHNNVAAALQSTEEAVAVYRRLSDDSSETFRVPLTSALNLLTRLQATNKNLQPDRGSPIIEQVDPQSKLLRKAPVRTLLGLTIGVLLTAVVALAYSGWLFGPPAATAAAVAVAVATVYALIRQERRDLEATSARGDLIPVRVKPTFAHVDDESGRFRVIDLFTKAVEQLGSERAAVRLGGMYALEYLAQLAPDQRQTVVDLICAYMRTPHSRPETDDPTRRLPIADGDQENHVRIAGQRILAVHLQPGTDTERPVETFWPDIDVDLSHAYLINFDLSGCHLRDATFVDTHFASSARFTGTRFGGHVRFDQAHFAGDARFDKAVFGRDTWFRRVSFAEDVVFDESSFRDDVIFTNIHVAGYASFTGVEVRSQARFSEVHFARHVGWTAASFCGDLWFSEIYFKGGTGFDHCEFKSNVRFNEIHFNGDAAFDHCAFAGDVWFNEVNFDASASFARAWFAGSVRVIGTTFAGSMPNELAFRTSSVTGDDPPPRYPD